MTRITRRRWFGPLVGLVTFLVVLVVGGGLTIVVDSGVRAAEMDVLLSEVEASELEMTVVQTEVQRISEEFGQLPSPTDADREQLVKDLAATAATGKQAIGEAGDAVGQLEFLPWHAALTRAQEDYLAHNLAWQEYLGRAAEDPLELTAPQDLVDSTFADSEVSMREAVPPVFGRALADRVDIIYAEPESASEGEGQAA